MKMTMRMRLMGNITHTGRRYENAYETFVGKSEFKMPLGRHRSK
jgi:hypothetical protein